MAVFQPAAGLCHIRHALRAPGRITPARWRYLYADTILWFDRPSYAGAALASGATLTTPALSSPVPYFVEGPARAFSFSQATGGHHEYQPGLERHHVRTGSRTPAWCWIACRCTAQHRHAIPARAHPAGGLSGHENEPGKLQALLDSFSVQALYEGVVVRLPAGPASTWPAATPCRSTYTWPIRPAGWLTLPRPISGVARTPELRLQNGTGISHVFSERYYPRLFSGQVFYHFGYRPEGFLQTRRVPVPVFFSEMSAGIRPDSLFILADTLVLDAGFEYGNRQWSTGAQGSGLVLRARDWPPGGRQAGFPSGKLSPYGCAVQDSWIHFIFACPKIKCAGSAPLLRMIHHTGWLSVQFDNAGEAKPPFLLSAEIINQTGKALYRTSG
ncbi:MAG: hypothetical protein IPM36_20820 [Lewinellaceae bacterium]|nr:hypothetical protein [Lewinellaceae bacterium]